MTSSHDDPGCRQLGGQELGARRSEIPNETVKSSAKNMAVVLLFSAVALLMIGVWSLWGAGAAVLFMGAFVLLCAHATWSAYKEMGK